MSECQTLPAVIVDEEFETLLPPLSAETRARLENDLAAHGQQDTIKVWKETGIVLDGHNRLSILDYLGVEPKIEWFSFPDRDAAKRWVLDRALAHRHMTPAQLDYVVGLRYELQKKEHGGDRNSSSQNDHLNEGRTNETLAKELGVSPKTIQRNAQFARSVDQIAEKAGAETRRAILDGSVRVKKQDAALLAEAKPAELKRAFRGGQEGVKHLVAKIRPDHSAEAGKMIEVKKPTDPEIATAFFDHDENAATLLLACPGVTTDTVGLLEDLILTNLCDLKWPATPNGEQLLQAFLRYMADQVNSSWWE